MPDTQLITAEKPLLTPEQAEQIRRADIANILKLAKQGKPLTSDQRKLIESVAGEAVPEESDLPKFAKNKVELAKLLGVSVKTIHRASALPGWPKPASDGRWPVAKCKAIVEKNFDVLIEQAGESTPPEGFGSWREYTEAQKGQREAVKLKKELGQVADKPFVAAMLARGYNQLFATQARVFLSELPAALEGLDAITIEVKLREALTLSHEEFRRSLAEWEKQTT